MLDKSIPYQHIYMIRGPVTETVTPQLPQGYTLRTFRDGDRDHWAAIETSVAEFENVEKAQAYFDRAYAPYADELSRRCVFACDPDGVPVATASAWWSEGEFGRLGMVHWVSVNPAHQGKGLGKAVMHRVLQLFTETEPGLPIMLHTQTWSHIAVRMYLSLGFCPLCDVSPVAAENKFDSAVKVLTSVMNDREVQAFVQCAVSADSYLSNSGPCPKEDL